jgi:phosphoglycerate dehydrogenase-like enzyme
MIVLLSEVAWRSYGARLRPVAPEAGWLRLQADGRLLDAGGAEVAWEEARPTVAWGTAELQDPGQPMNAFFSLLRRTPTIEWFASFAAGVDHPVFAELVRGGMRLTTSHVGDVPIAEHVLRAALDHLQGAARWREDQAACRWQVHDRHREVRGTTWLVIGLGSIGSEVARLAGAFGATVVGVRRHPRGHEPVDELLPPGAVADALPRADVVVLTAPSTAETRGMVDAAFLGAMRSGSLLVNVARGDLVDEAALLAALDTGVPAAAVLDVTAVEPLPPEHPLWRHPAVTITPHSSAHTTGRFDRAADEMVENLARWVRGEALVAEVTEGDLP